MLSICKARLDDTHCVPSQSPFATHNYCYSTWYYITALLYLLSEFYTDQPQNWKHWQVVYLITMIAVKGWVILSELSVHEVLETEQNGRI